MFLLNLGYRWNLLSDIEGLQGTVLLPVFNTSVRVERDQRGRGLRRNLLDPQLYLASMDVRGRSTACARLSTYPWFCVPDVGRFDSSKMGRQDWERELHIRIEQLWPGRDPDDPTQVTVDAVEFQERVGCTHVILPAPLIAEREDEGESAGIWLDEGIKAAKDLDISLPLIATVAICDSTLNDAAFRSDGLIEGIVDHVTARGSEVDGIYVVVVLKGRLDHPFRTPLPVIRAYLDLVNKFRLAGLHEIIVNFADIAGFVACGTGASGFATGQSRSLRTVNIEGFLDDGGGVALPHYYSHKTAGEYLSQSDLDTLADAKAFRRISDRTRFSDSLVDTVVNGGTAAGVTGWAESQNNLADAQRHFIQRLILEGASLAPKPMSERYQSVVEWLETAESNALFVEKRTRAVHGSSLGRRAPALEWLDILQDITA